MRLFLEFVPEQGQVHRLRLIYAFRLFCAIYGHEPIIDSKQAHTADAWLSYTKLKSPPGAVRRLCLSNLYSPRLPRVPASPPTQFQNSHERTVLFYAPEPGDLPDWLAEIFEWVSCADEHAVTERDSVGRVPFTSSYVGRYSLNVGQPYAAIAMHLLQQVLCTLVPSCRQQSVCPAPSCRHFIINTHDVDFFPMDRFGSVRRLTKNAMISLLAARSPRLAFGQAVQAVRTAVTTENVLDQMPALISGELKRSVGASFFFITQNRHRRDANYKVEQSQVVRFLRDLTLQGMEVGVHGSYTSLDKRGELQREFARLRDLGFRPYGGRQHWLRFTLDRLIRAVENTGASYDASLGWNDQVGFRAGACFAFPPYDFENERAANFIEIPLVIMDQALQERAKNTESRFQLAAELLATSRRYGWGGVSVLWHPAAFGGGQLSPDVGRIFWSLLDHRAAWEDTWTSATEFVSAIRERYSQVGLVTAKPQLEYAASPVAGLAS
jgi:hypothetical protein